MTCFTITLSILALCASSCAALVDRHVRATTLRAARLGARSPSQYGNPKCPCVGFDDVKGQIELNVETLTGPATHVFPAEYGASCEPWESKGHPDCETGTDRNFTRDGERPGWCTQPFCYVDPCNCDIASIPKVSAYMEGATYQGRTVYYSYATCGAEDLWTEKNSKVACVNQKTETGCGNLAKCAWTGKRCVGKEVHGACDKPVDSVKHGAEDCRCIGFDGRVGTIEATVPTESNPDGEIHHFPAQYGATCKAWEAGLHPDCKGAAKPEWCDQQWCFVDPCSCGQVEPPKVTSGWLGKTANFQGKQLYYSYTACGGADEFTKEYNLEACVNQKSQEKCESLAGKCAWTESWTESKCLGKELVDTCHTRSNSMSIDTNKLVPLFMLSLLWLN